jgi:hypothetical protein
MGSKRVPYWVLIWVVVAHILAFSWALRTENWDFPDSDRYVQVALNLKHYGQLYARAWPQAVLAGQSIQEFSIRTPGYPGIILGLGGETGHFALLLISQNILSLLTIGVVLCWWARWAQPRGKEWVGALLCVLTFPAQLIYANAVMSEIVLQAVVLAMLAGGLLYMKTQQLAYFLAVAAASIAALLLKPVFYPLAAIIAVIGVALGWRTRQLGFVLVGLLPTLVVMAYMEWNQQRTGYFHFSSIAEINMLHYNAAGVVRQLDGPQAEESWVAGVLREAALQPDFATRQRLIQTRASAVLWAHPLVYAKQHLLGMVAFFLDPGRFDISEFLNLDPLPGGGFLAQARSRGLWTAIQRLPLGLMSGLGLVLLANLGRLVLAVRGFWHLRQAQKWACYGRWLALGLLCYVAGLTGPLGAARFLVPVWPLLLGLALAGLKSGMVEDAKPATDVASV